LEWLCRWTRKDEVEAASRGMQMFGTRSEWPRTPQLLTRHDSLILHALGVAWNGKESSRNMIFG